MSFSTSKPRRLKTMDDLPLDGKRVLLRADLNVTVGSDGVVDSTEDYRIQAVMQTIEELLQRRCKVLIIAHHGRPEENTEETDMEPIRRRLEYLLRGQVRQLSAMSGSAVSAVVDGLEPGSAVLLPNVRGDQRELTEDHRFAAELASNGDAYVNEAFAVSHRKQASVSLLPTLLLSCAGRRTVEEVRVLDNLRQQPARPYVAIASGAKITTKITLLHSLLKRVDTLCVGGKLANVLLAAQNAYSQAEFTDADMAAAKEVLASPDSKKLLLPSDVIIGNGDGTASQTVLVDAMAAGSAGVWDIGPKTVQQFIEACRLAKTVLWNGPVGRVELPAYAQGTVTLAEQLAQMPAYRVVGGGDTVNVLERLKLADRYDHVSVGGGALVAYLEGSPMPGLEPLYI